MHHAYPSSQSAGLRAPRHRHRLVLDTARHQGRNGPTPSWTHNNLSKPWLLLTVLNPLEHCCFEHFRGRNIGFGCGLSCLLIIVPLHLILIKLFCGANKMFLRGYLMYFHLFILLWISLSNLISLVRLPCTSVLTCSLHSVWFLKSSHFYLLGL